jgi:hypothetical protein
MVAMEFSRDISQGSHLTLLRFINWGYWIGAEARYGTDRSGREHRCLKFTFSPHNDNTSILFSQKVEIPIIVNTPEFVSAGGNGLVTKTLK